MTNPLITRKSNNLFSLSSVPFYEFYFNNDEVWISKRMDVCVNLLYYVSYEQTYNKSMAAVSMFHLTYMNLNYALFDSCFVHVLEDPM